jgi:hypothetical protein
LSNEEKTNDYENFEKGMIYMKILKKGGVVEKRGEEETKSMPHAPVSSTQNYMIYGELGRFPIEIDKKIRMVSFWARLLLGKETKLSYLSYKLLLKKMFTSSGLNI